MNVHVPKSESERLAALHSYDVLDTPTELVFDRITRIAMNGLNVPMAAISLIDGHRQWLKSRQGPLNQQTCKDDSFCSVAIQMPEPLVVEDAAADPRFKDNALVLGPPHIRFYAGASLRTPAGHNIGALCVIDTTPRHMDETQLTLLRDLADMVMSAFEARRLALTDGLTGALTRRGFRDEAERALSLSVRYSHALSCIVFDLDHFKSINDAHGHAVGDQILIEAVKACQDRLRSSDILGRVGGEEFAVVLPHTDATGAMAVAEEIRAALQRQLVVLPDVRVPISASFGVATRSRADVDLDELLRHADLAMCSAKDAGRNSCVAWKPPAGSTAVPGGMRRVLKAGQIVFNSGRSIIDCTVKAIGDAGARIEVVSTVGIPDKFKLAIVGDGFSRGCVVSAKQNLIIEVAFA